jgi:hypothetical protein
MLHWLAAHQGRARIVLGTRLAILASLPHLKLIVIDEEHDPSYKQQEGLRYSARDLAVWRAHQLAIPDRARLGHAVAGELAPRAVGPLPQAGTARARRARRRAAARALIDMERDKPKEGLTSHADRGAAQRLERGEQSLLFLNRRGYAPVMCCEACGWISNCTRCTAFMVLHKPEHRLRCHHCSLELRIPRPARPAATSTCSRWGAAPSASRKACSAVPGGAHPAHRRRFHAPQGQRPGRVRHRAPRRGRHPDRHADGRQGPRLQKADAGRHPESGHRAVLAGLPRQRAPVRAADAGGGPRRRAQKRRAAASARC